MKRTRYYGSALLVCLAACQPADPPSDAEAGIQYQDAEAVYMTLTVGEAAPEELVLSAVSGRIHVLPATIDTLPWQLELKALSDQETLAADITALTACLQAPSSDCVGETGHGLLRGQRVFLHCTGMDASPRPRLRDCTLGTDRADSR